ncbi:aminoglycoside phosphotransferase family protein [Parvularcula sp. IMCC14364]|uniref:aminoglycoside phosphotransferase family protein n=1 Tax=Parvularcula sp. IMCC14364 TaxID=3067902 RepID=UPI002741A248|nr:phosphotransferase [Parvularcula sp. IMCC14364]
MSDRQNVIENFLASTGWQDAQRLSLTADASTRTYLRLTRNGETALLMDAPPVAETASCPQGATEEERKALGYNAEARLAGPNLHAFVEIARMLRKTGLCAPEIFAHDASVGLALIEDLGDNLYTHHSISPQAESEAYAVAVAALAHLHQAELAWPNTPDYCVQDYDALAMMAEVTLLPEWYLPFSTGIALSDENSQEYISIWRALLQGVSAPSVFVMRDYHAENLLWLDNKAGIRRAGIIDFQDGLKGQPAYDLVSLIEDARRDVSEVLAVDLKDQYINHMRNADSAFDVAGFERDYAILAAQRNAKILGIFARLVQRDGKPKYKALLPRVEDHFRSDIARSGLEPLREWVQLNLPGLGAS